MNKVKNKKIIRKIADRTLKAKKSRNLIGILAIVLTSLLFTGVFTIGGNLTQKQQEETMRQVGGSAHAGYKYLTKEEYDIVKKDKKLRDVSSRIVVGDAVNEEFLKLPTEIGYYEDLEAKWSFCYPEVGHMPQKEEELVTSDLVLKALGIPIGMLLGAGVGVVLLPVVMNHLTFAASTTNAVQWNPWIFLGSGLFSLITVGISCQKPGAIASKVSPIEAVRFTEGQNQAFQKEKKRKKKRKTRTVSPAVMAAANLGRNKKKLCIVVASLSLSLILVNAVHSLICGFDMDRFAEDRAISDYMVFDASLDVFTTSGGQVLDGVTKEFQEELAKQKGILETGGVYIKELPSKLSPEEFQKFDEKFIQHPDIEAVFREDFGDEYEQIIEGYRKEQSVGGMKYYGIDQMIFEHMDALKGNLDWETFSNGNYVLTNMYPFVHDKVISYHEPGEKVTLTNEKGEKREYEVLAVSEIPYAVSTQSYGAFDCTYILPTQEFQEFFGPRQPMRLLFNVEKEQEEALEAWVEHYCTVTNSNLQYISKTSIAEEFSGLKNMYGMIGGMLAFILALIGILNFLNTMAASILSRKQEFAALEAVGMTGKQLKTMLCTEGIYYAAGTLVIALFASVILNLTVLKGLEETLFFFKNHFTLLPLALCIVPLLLVVLMVPILGYQNIRRQSVVERMREGEV